MARLPADEDYARALLSIFSTRQYHDRRSLRLSEAQAAFLGRNMGRLADFEAALEYAMHRGWLARALNSVRLTAPGVEEMLFADGRPVVVLAPG